MKRLSLVLAIAALALPQAGQAGWFRTYGGAEWDAGHCVQEIEDGYIITGSTHSFGAGQADLWLLKTDTLGDTLWEKTYGWESTNEVGYFVRETNDGGIIITGRLDNNRIWLLKTDSEGDTVWTRTFGTGFGYCVQQLDDNGYILLSTKFYGATITPSYLMLLRTNTDGDSLWAQLYLPDDWVYSMGYFIDRTEDGGFIISGLVRDTTFENEKTACWILRTDSEGDTLWTFIQGGDNWGDLDQGRCVRETIAEEYIACANFGLLKLNSLGDTIWARSYRNGSSVDVTADDGFILTGDASMLQAVSQLNTMPDPLWLLKTNNIGDSLWKQFYSVGESNYIEETRDKGFIISGVTGTNSGDVFLLKTDSLGLLGITENPIVETDNGWNVPHSIGSYVVLHYQGLPQGFRANVFDVSGRKVDQIRGDGNEGAMTWGINQPPGVYFIQALDNRNQLKTTKVVLVR